MANQEKHKPHVGYIKYKYFNPERKETTGYKLLWSWNEELLMFAIKNFCIKYGIFQADSISKEEYESNTQIQKQ